MKKFMIENKISGLVLGIYEGETPEDALASLAKDATGLDPKGYKEYCKELEIPDDGSDLNIIELD